MSRNSPTSSSISSQEMPRILIQSRNTNTVSNKLKLKHFVIQKIFTASIAMARESLQSQKENADERLETLVNVEREYVQHLVGSRKKYDSACKLIIPEHHKTPNTQILKNLKRKKRTSISNLSNCRKTSVQRRHASGVCSPQSGTLSKILF